MYKYSEFGYSFLKVAWRNAEVAMFGWDWKLGTVNGAFRLQVIMHTFIDLSLGAFLDTWWLLEGTYFLPIIIK